MPLTPEQRTLRARTAAHSMHAAGRTNTAAARAAFARKFEDAVDPQRTLHPAERAKRAAHARSAHMSALALRSSIARQAAGTGSS